MYRKLIITPIDPSTIYAGEIFIGEDAIPPNLPGQNNLFSLKPKNPNWVAPTRSYRFSGFHLMRKQGRNPDYNLLILPPKNQRELYTRTVIRRALFNYRNRTVYIAQSDGTLVRPSTYIRDSHVDPLILRRDPESIQVRRRR